jgi:hypothetical protein
MADENSLQRFQRSKIANHERNGSSKGALAINGRAVAAAVKTRIRQAAMSEGAAIDASARCRQDGVLILAR